MLEKFQALQFPQISIFHSPSLLLIREGTKEFWQIMLFFNLNCGADRKRNGSRGKKIVICNLFSVVPSTDLSMMMVN